MCSTISEKDLIPLSSSQTASHERIQSLSAGSEILQASPEKLADCMPSDRDDADGLSDLTASAPITVTAAPENVHSVCDHPVPDDELAASKTANHKRIRSLSMEGEMLQPPSKKLESSSSTVSERLDKDEIGGTNDMSGPSSVTATPEENSGGSVLGRSAADNDLATNDAVNGVDAGEDVRGIHEVSENFAQSNTADAGPTMAKKPWQRPKLDWYNRTNVFADTTLKNKIGGLGMVQFLAWEGVDVETEFAEMGKKYKDAKGSTIARNEAMKNKAQEVHQAYIDARTAGTRQVPLGWVNRDFLPGYEPSLPGSVQAHALPPASPGNGAATTGVKKASHSRKRQAATVANKDNGVVLQTRKDLQAIHRQAAEQLVETYERRLQGIIVSVPEPAEPVISTAVDRLVYNILDRQMHLRLIRVVHEHRTTVEDDHADIMNEIQDYRAALATELQRTVKWETGQDPMLLVAQEFPVDF
ncbi:uncharacterized protein N0V89_006866 [Didymosphaeria variabile]|uniref:Uncharacterized protein n=1 Tax=Didymosphaeria variabile TaxID=1932322 RepID=A0A9W8XHU9_9PLEO|nr:uncharacterized protein N0V89_006866 [Didymosphaeria variabile]KAJ4351523.1 hypothetical protein N0V89_006866 [Didymosphaeria variabile]